MSTRHSSESNDARKVQIEARRQERQARAKDANPGVPSPESGETHEENPGSGG